MLKHIYGGVVLLGLVAMAAHGNTADKKDKDLPNGVQGRVFQDANNNGRIDAGEKGIAGVVVSDGREVVVTDSQGRYQLPLESQDASFIFITTPSGYRCSTSFYQRKPSPEHPTADFGLICDPASAASTFSFAQITDIHIGLDGQNSIRTFQEDLAEINQQKEAPSFVVATGDLVTESKAAFYDDYLTGVKTYPKRYFHVLGNHDIPVANYERYLGPSYYSFDYGPVHFVVLNSIDPDGYVSWLKKDLDHQPQGKVIVAFQHYQPEKPLLDLLSSYNTRALLYGHWHSNKAFYYRKILVLSTPPLRFGGIDCSSRGYRLVTVDKGAIRTRCAWGGMEALEQKQEGPAAEGPYRLEWKTTVNEGTGITAPWVDGDRMYIGVQDDDNVVECGIVCMDARDGKRLWKAKTDSSIHGRPVVSHGVLCAISVMGTVYGWEAASGQLRWTYSLGNPWERWVYTSPVVAGGRVYGGVAPWFVCLDLMSGKKIWQAPVLGTDWISCRSNPAVDDSAVYLNVNWSGGLTALNRNDGSVIWNKKEGFMTTHSSPVVQGPHLLDLADSRIYCLDKKTGDSCWKVELGGDWKVSTPAVQDGMLVVGSPQGEVLAMKVTTGEKLWSFKTGPSLGSFSPYIRKGSQVMASPVIAGDWVYVGANDGAFYILNRTSGQPVWRYQTNRPIFSTPWVSGDRFYFSNGNREIFAFKKVKKLK